MQTYFLRVKPLAECAAKDGVLLGHLLADVAEKASLQDRASAITTFVLRTTILRECGFVSLDGMLAALFVTHYGLARFKTIFARPVPTANPAAVTAVEATTMGSGLDAILRTSTDHREAVDEFLATYLAMDVMAQRQVWFRPMLETIAKRRMARAPLGLKLRLTVGAVLSIADMLSDLFNIVQMFLAGQILGAYALLAMILASLASQIALVVIQNSHRGKRVLAWEILLVLSLFKAGVDAIRVAGGEEQVAGSPMDPLMEMLFGKGIEMVFESIPGAVLQMVLLLYGNWTTAAMLSILMSCLSTAFTATMLAYDLDTNAAKRKFAPEFYGYGVPTDICDDQPHSCNPRLRRAGTCRTPPPSAR